MQENRDVLKKIGVEINDEKIAIDLKKTKSFFTMLQELLQQKAQDLQKNLEEGKLEIEDVGVRVSMWRSIWQRQRASSKLLERK